MNAPAVPSATAHPDALAPQALIRTYVRAKDENRPHLMAHAFAPDATLEMTVKSETIAFPGRSEGLAAISDVLVRRFGQTYDNVYTFCLTDAPPGAEAGRYGCDWLVGMTDKATGGVRVGCGSYAWVFSMQAGIRRVQALTIVIEAMEVLPADAAQPVLDGWLARLPYPWCTAGQACGQAPALAQLAPVLAYLQAGAGSGDR
ncbi:nuclear transport factor 2 family protein [Cupriavidus basilensis]|uniref:Nuclear transport factor 2 family protein n=1 Tax=Cupriavidus basilensis TaxID=68895 RepID=A0ABT6B213_9BURK|nr:nuclear transport factor 2 family protein [Cupriavidus basilensis]MDF3838924.1 nuclear transport factor 2 family protein [Cupriavidus basilensis]